MDDDTRHDRRLLGRLLAGPATVPSSAVGGRALDLSGWDDERWSALVWTARSGRVVPTLAAAVAAGRIDPGAGRSDELVELWRAAMARCVHLEARLLWLHAELQRAGVEMRVLKGSASAHLDHRRPELREFGDVDVLIRPGDLPKVFEVLRADGFTRRFPEPAPGFDQRFAKSVSWSGDVEFDVHRTVAEGPIGHRIPIDDLWTGSTPVVIAGTQLWALDRTARFLHACLHAELAPPPVRLATIGDLVRLLPTIDAAEVADRAAGWAVAPLVDAAIGAVLRLGAAPEGVVAPGLSSETPVGMLEAALIAAHRDPDSSWAVRAAASIVTLPDWSTRWRYLRMLAFPSSSYVGGRHAGRAARIRHFARRVGRELHSGWGGRR